MAYVITLIGGGGKTSLMYFIAGFLKSIGVPVAVTTTTKLRRSVNKASELLFAADENEFRDILHNAWYSTKIPTVVKRINSHDSTKVDGFSLEIVDRIARSYTDLCIIVEGDGSAGKSLKGHVQQEPVIPKSSRLLLPVIGADIFNKPINDTYVHRALRITELTGRRCGSVIDNALIASLLCSRSAYLHNAPPQAAIVPVVNKVEHLSQYQQAFELAAFILPQKQLGIKGIVIGSVRQKQLSFITDRFAHNFTDLLKKLVNRGINSSNWH